MNGLSEAMRRAIISGYAPLQNNQDLLNPFFWISLGKYEQWTGGRSFFVHTIGAVATVPEWLVKQHEMIDWIANSQGKSVDEYFHGILKPLEVY